MCSLTAMNGLGTEVLRTRITGVRDQDQKGLLEKRYCGTQVITFNNWVCTGIQMKRVFFTFYG